MVAKEKKKKNGEKCQIECAPCRVDREPAVLTQTSHSVSLSKEEEEMFQRNNWKMLERDGLDHLAKEFFIKFRNRLLLLLLLPLSLIL